MNADCFTACPVCGSRPSVSKVGAGTFFVNCNCAENVVVGPTQSVLNSWNNLMREKLEELRDEEE